MGSLHAATCKIFNSRASNLIVEIIFQGFLDDDGYEKVNNMALRTKRAVDNGNWFQSTDLWYQTEIVLLEYNLGVDFYNVLFDTRYRSSEESAALARRFQMSPRDFAFDTLVKRKGLAKADESDDEDNDTKLQRLMRGAVHTALGLSPNITWGSQSGAVFDTLAGDFMKPVVATVEELLNNSTIHVVVYSGQLDLICSTPGTMQWVNRMNWHGSKEYLATPRLGIGVNNILEGYSRRFGNFSMFWINKAGHMAPFGECSGIDYAA